MTQPHPIKFPPEKFIDFLVDASLPWFNALRAAHGFEPAPFRIGEPVSAEQARAAWDEYQAAESLRWGGCTPQPETPRTPNREREPRRPKLARIAAQASKAGIEVARYEIKPDGTVVVVTGGEPEPAAAENPWPLDEFQRKDIKQ
jgi:hypothetical protein